MMSIILFDISTACGSEALMGNSLSTHKCTLVQLGQELRTQEFGEKNE
jgi:hypothetical protein